jgi:hypothetical protein
MTFVPDDEAAIKKWVVGVGEDIRRFVDSTPSTTPSTSTWRWRSPDCVRR